MQMLADRRLILKFSTGLLVAPACSLVAAENMEATARKRLIGAWQSDRERTMRSWYSQGSSLTELQRERIGQLFGHVTWTITARTFAYQVPPMTRPKVRAYRMAGATSSSATLEILGRKDSMDTFSITVYFDGDALFVKVGHNFEYFRRLDR